MKERLKDVVSAATVPSAGDDAPTNRRRLSRRAALGIVAAAIPLLLWVWFAPRVSPLTEADIRRLAELDVDSLPNAPAAADFSLPAGWDRLRGVQFGDPARVVSVGNREVPVLPIVRVRSRSPHAAGFVARLTAFGSQPPVEATSFSTATIQYSSLGCWVVWREGNAIYLCVLRDMHAMERLRGAVADGRGLT
jgi:hypothetical protein